METAHRRIIVAGGLGFFGVIAIKLLREMGLQPLAASRRAGADLQLNVEDEASLCTTLQAGDVLLDAAGPFQNRSTLLIQAAIVVGYDVVDLSDSLDYAQRVQALEPRIAAAGIRVFNACSTVSALTAFLARQSRIEQPVRLSGFLMPATHYTPSPSTSVAMLGSIGRPVHVFRGGRLITAAGWSDSRRAHFPPPVGSLHGHLFESADGVWLPRVWPSLRQVELFLDTRSRPLNAVFSAAARSRAIHRLVERCQSFGQRLVRSFGSRSSGLAVEVEAADGTIRQQVLYADDAGHRMAVAPAVLAVRRLATRSDLALGLILPHQVDDQELSALLHSLDVRLQR